MVYSVSSNTIISQNWKHIICAQLNMWLVGIERVKRSQAQIAARATLLALTYRVT